MREQGLRQAAVGRGGFHGIEQRHVAVGGQRRKQIGHHGGHPADRRRQGAEHQHTRRERTGVHAASAVRR